MVNVSNPANPTSLGCLSAGGYVHDAQCVIYSGPDTRYTGREICFNFNEDTLDITDVTSKGKPTTISSTGYTGASYTHQGWIADLEQRFLLLDDELDEQRRRGPAANQHTTTYIVDISNLKSPRFTGTYQSPAISIDHNQYVVDGLSYQAKYGSGLRIIDVTSLGSDPTGRGIREVGFFDVHPEDDDVNGRAEFVGTWSVYPFFKSGHILLNSIERGAYVLKYTG
jgi:choice-of-anchor B domain-containing protein